MIRIIEQINPIHSPPPPVHSLRPFAIHQILNQFDIQINQSRLKNDPSTVAYFFELLTNQTFGAPSEKPFQKSLEKLFKSLLKSDQDFFNLLPAIDELPFPIAVSIWIVLYKTAANMYRTPRIEIIRKTLLKILETSLATDQGQALIAKGIILSIDTATISENEKLACIHIIKPYFEKPSLLLLIAKLSLIALTAFGGTWYLTNKTKIFLNKS